MDKKKKDEIILEEGVDSDNATFRIWFAKHGIKETARGQDRDECMAILQEAQEEVNKLRMNQLMRGLGDTDKENEPKPRMENKQAPHKERMAREYRELKERADKLHTMLVKWEAGTLTFEPTCPQELLERQHYAMMEYLHVLRIRAEIEEVDLDE